MILRRRRRRRTRRRRRKRRRKGALCLPLRMILMTRFSKVLILYMRKMYGKARECEGERTGSFEKFR